VSRPFDQAPFYDGYLASANTLFVVQMFLMNWAEVRRWQVWPGRYCPPRHRHTLPAAAAAAPTAAAAAAPTAEAGSCWSSAAAAAAASLAAASAAVAAAAAPCIKVQVIL
jgi:hypothetical protein